MSEATSTTTTTTPAAPPPAPTLEQAVLDVFGPPDAVTTPAETVTTAVDGAEKPAAEAASDGAATDKPDPQQERVGARLAAAKRAELRASREREDLRAQRDSQEKRDADLKAREAEVRLLEDDPVKYFEIKKRGPRAIAEHLEKLAGTYKPEAIEAKKLTDVEERIATLEAEIKRRDEAEQVRVRTEQQTVAEREAGTAFIAHVGGAADKYPHLTQEFSESEAVTLAFTELTKVIRRDAEGRPVTRVQAYVAEHGEPPDNDVIAEHLDAIAKARIEARAKSGWRKPGEAAESASKANGQQREVPPAKGTSPRTLTSRDASTRASAPKPWSQEAADEESVRILEAAFRKPG